MFCVDSKRLQRGVGVGQPADEIARRYTAATAAESGKISTHQNLAVRLHRESADSDIRAGIEIRVNGAVSAKPSDTLALCRCRRGW